MTSHARERVSEWEWGRGVPLPWHDSHPCVGVTPRLAGLPLRTGWTQRAATGHTALHTRVRLSRKRAAAHGTQGARRSAAQPRRTSRGARAPRRGGSEWQAEWACTGSRGSVMGAWAVRRGHGRRAHQGRQCSAHGHTRPSRSTECCVAVHHEQWHTQCTGHTQYTWCVHHEHTVHSMHSAHTMSTVHSTHTVHTAHS